MVKIQDEKSGEIKSILLVGFGKMGAEKDIGLMEKKEGTKLYGAHVKFKGTRIYHDGKELLELTEGVNSFLEKSTIPAMHLDIKKEKGSVTLRGEIYDPKCAFGVMKPGYGKPHRSCAVRCISGGIPPVLKMTNKNGEANYCLLVGPNGEAINQLVLEYVADQIQICGELKEEDDWLVLYTDPTADILRLQPHFIEGEIPLCGELTN